MNDDHRFHDHSFATEVAGPSSSKGATIVEERLNDKGS